MIITRMSSLRIYLASQYQAYVKKLFDEDRLDDQLLYSDWAKEHAGDKIKEFVEFQRAERAKMRRFKQERMANEQR